MTNEFNRKAAYWPTDPAAARHLETQIEIGNLGAVEGIAQPGTPRFLVTFMRSDTSGRIRSGTVVTVTNLQPVPNRVSVAFYRGFSNSPACVCTMTIPPEFTVDFCSRPLPDVLTTCNCTGSSGLEFHEGRAIISSLYPRLGVSSRVYYTSGAEDQDLLAITDSKIVDITQGNQGE